MRATEPLTNFEKLAFAPEFAPECASWLYIEWGYRNPVATLADVTKRFLARANIDELPIAFVAHHGGKPVGTASLVAKEDLSDTYGPWVASVFVAEGYRGTGIARQLIKMAESEAAELGFPRVWLTAAVPVLYEKPGYQLTDQMKHGEPVMVKCLSDPKLQD